MTRLFLSLLICSTYLFSKNIQAQVAIGYLHDFSGVPIHGIADMNYEPFNSVYFRLINDFQVGTIHLNDGKTLEGKIKYDEKFLDYSPIGYPFYERKKAQYIKSAMLGSDSCISFTNYEIAGKIKSKPRIGQFITQVNGTQFLLLRTFSEAAGVNMDEVYIFSKSKANGNWEPFSIESRYIEQTKSHLANLPHLIRKIDGNKVGYDQMLPLIKEIEFENKRLTNSLIYFDNYWNQIHNPLKATYTARITNRVDSLWTIQYYSNDLLLYEVKYTSLYPYIRNGEYKCFYPDGKIRALYFYEKNRLKWGKHFSKKKLLDIHIVIQNDLSIKYEFVSDSLGKNLLSTSGTVSRIVYDEKRDVHIEQFFEEGRMVYARRKNKEGYIYQTTESVHKADIKSLQNKFEDFLNKPTIEFVQTDKNDVEGTYFLHLEIDNDGKITSYNILNNLHPELDTIFASFVDKKIYNKDNGQFKFHPYELNNKSQRAEFVVPFNFSIDRFTRKENNNHYDHHY
jgi:hypothetical protein